MPFFPYEVEHTLFDDMATDGMNCLAMTGFSSAHLAYVWNTYGAHLKPVNWRPKAFKCRAGRSYSITILHFFLLFTFIHLYPLTSQMPHTLRVKGFKRGIGKTTFRKQIVPMAMTLALVMNEVQWDDRLDQSNHHAFFPVGVTTVWDTAPIYVATPSDPRINKLLYQPKYKNCCFKVQIAVTFTSQIVYFSALHVGAAHDGTIFNDTLEEHPFEEWEYGLGDKIYQRMKRILIGHRRYKGTPLTPLQLEDNDKFDFVRSRVARARVHSAPEPRQ